MSKFLRTMERLSKRPSDFQKSVGPAAAAPALETTSVPPVHQSPSVEASTPPTEDYKSTEDSQTTVGKQTTVDGVKLQCFQAKTAQDGHTVWEQVLYQALWASGKGEDVRVVTAGYRTLAAACRLSDKAVKRNLRSLERKLAIEPIAQEDSHTRTGRTYRVYSYRILIERRKAAGLQWVERRRNAVTLVGNPSTVVFQSTVDIKPTVDSQATVDTQAPATGDIQTTSTVGIQSPPKENRKEEEKESSSSDTYRSSIVNRLADTGIPIDDDVGRKLIRRCQAVDSTATEEEIIHFTELKIQQLVKRKNIENWPGLLLAAVPAYFETPATELRRYREQMVHKNEQSRELARRVLEDPNASSDEQRWAQRELNTST